MSTAIMRGPAPVLVADSRTRINSLEREWKHLYRASNAPNPFLSWEWQRSWIESQAACSTFVVLATSTAGAPEGLLALQRVRHRGLRVLEFLAQPSNGDDFDCLLDAEAGPETAIRLLRAALSSQSWDLLRCASVRAGSALEPAWARMAGLARPMREPGEWLPTLQLPDRFETYLTGQSANFRAQLRRRRRALEQRQPRVWLECLTDPGDVSRDLAQLYRLHNLRRRQLGAAGMFQSAAARRFVNLAAARLAAGGASRLYLLRDRGSVIAALFGIEAGRRFFYYQSGFDPDWAAFSPGTVLLSYVIEDCIKCGLRQFEFLRGDEAYKGRWTNERRQNFTLVAAGSPLGMAYLRLRAWRQQRLGAAA
ncbi:MAG: GNAT family N-acetyltransferase [Terriglobales bacterium]